MINIKITKEAAFCIAACVVSAGVAIYSYFKGKKDSEKLKKEIDEFLGNAEGEAEEKTLRNSNLSVDERVEAMNVATYLKRRITNAVNEKELDAAIDRFDRFLSGLSEEDTEILKTHLKYYKERISELKENEKEEIKRQHDENNFKQLASSFNSLAGSLVRSAASGSDLKRIFSIMPPTIKDPITGRLKYWNEKYQSFWYV